MSQENVNLARRVIEATAHFAENAVAVGGMQLVIRHALPVRDDGVVLLMDLDLTLP